MSGHAASRLQGWLVCLGGAARVQALVGVEINRVARLGSASSFEPQLADRRIPRREHVVAAAAVSHTKSRSLHYSRLVTAILARARAMGCAWRGWDADVHATRCRRPARRQCAAARCPWVHVWELSDKGGGLPLGAEERCTPRQ